VRDISLLTNCVHRAVYMLYVRCIYSFIQRMFDICVPPAPTNTPSPARQHDMIPNVIQPTLWLVGLSSNMLLVAYTRQLTMCNTMYILLQ